MGLKVVGAGLPRTGTSSLRYALQHLLGEPCYHMSAIPGHPFDLGGGWDTALAGGSPDWDRLFSGYSATVDWPSSMFWRELSAANPQALVLLSVRDSAETWWQSLDQTVLGTARASLAPDWREGRSLVTLFERFTGTDRWDDPALLMSAYEQHNAAVRSTAPRERLLEWRTEDGWEPLCTALSLRLPGVPFPWLNRRGEWG